MNQTIPNKLQLVVIDDDPAIVRIVTRVIQQALGDIIDVVDFTDPNEARQWIDQHCCDVLITDLQMPEVDGLELLQFTKARNPWTQVIFLTGHSSLQAISEAIENGASDYLVKPLDQFEMVDVLRQAHLRFVRWRKALGQTIHKPATV